jgi:hypothetical protein
MKKSRQCVKRQRPLWWTQEGVLEKLRAGEFVMAVCQQAAEEMARAGVQISAVRLRAEISGWCESATWGEQLREALAMWKRSGSGEMVLSKHWHDDFFDAMDRCNGNGSRAAAMVGVGYGVVLALQDRRHKCYDAEFAERFKIAELDRVGVIREKYMETAEAGEGKGALRAQERIIEAALPGLHGQKQELHVSGKVEHEHEHIHGMSAELAREVVASSQNRIRRLTAGRQAELSEGVAGAAESEGRVIDVIPIQERERARA